MIAPQTQPPARSSITIHKDPLFDCPMPNAHCHKTINPNLYLVCSMSIVHSSAMFNQHFWTVVLNLIALPSRKNYVVTIEISTHESAPTSRSMTVVKRVFWMNWFLVLSLAFLLVVWWQLICNWFSRNGAKLFLIVHDKGFYCCSAIV